MKADTCVVVGAGLGGLTTAIRIAKLGLKVHLYEQAEKVGGKANSLDLKGFRFDTGPSLLTLPFVLEEIFIYCGLKIEDYLTIEPLSQHCKYFYPDGVSLTAFADVHKFASEIEKHTSEKKEHLLQYLAYCKTIYDLTADLFMYSDFHDIKTFIEKSSFKTLFNISKIDSMRTMHKANSSFFSDDKIIQLFDRYATYNGSNPYKAPATLNIISHVEYNMGSYIIKEGIYAIPLALKKVAEDCGVIFHYNSKVQNVVYDKRKVKGITVNDEFIPCDLVVSNVDAYSTYHDLLHDHKSKGAKKYQNLEPSSSALVFYWGVNRSSSELDIHNILFSENYEQEFHELFTEKRCPHDPTVYIYISSKFNPQDSPAGKENWFVMINAPYDSEQDWDKEIEKSRRAVKHKIKSILNIDMDDFIECEDVLTPPLIAERTSSHKGSLYGISSNTKTAAFLRQRNKSKYYKGLYFCGGSVHPGGGMPLVMLSGKLVAEKIEKEYL